SSSSGTTSSFAFTSAPLTLVDTLLVDSLFASLTSLHIGTLQRALDWSRLLTAPLPNVQLLTLFVPGDKSIAHSWLVDIFQASSGKRWSLPSLQRLHVKCREELLDLVPVGRPTVSAERLRKFVAESLWTRWGQSLELTLEGVELTERWSSPEVVGLKGVVAAVVCQNYPS
ncbi:hypothetical protein EXIGLDRAFT_718831, partial [Exidia glandulosa HHB12029]